MRRRRAPDCTLRAAPLQAAACHTCITCPPATKPRFTAKVGLNAANGVQTSWVASFLPDGSAKTLGLAAYNTLGQIGAPRGPHRGGGCAARPSCCVAPPACLHRCSKSACEAPPCPPPPQAALLGRWPLARCGSAPAATRRRWAWSAAASRRLRPWCWCSARAGRAAARGRARQALAVLGRVPLSHAARMTLAMTRVRRSRTKSSARGACDVGGLP